MLCYINLTFTGSINIKRSKHTHYYTHTVTKTIERGRKKEGYTYNEDCLCNWSVGLHSFLASQILAPERLCGQSLCSWPQSVIPSSHPSIFLFYHLVLYICTRSRLNFIISSFDGLILCRLLGGRPCGLLLYSVFTNCNFPFFVYVLLEFQEILLCWVRMQLRVCLFLQNLGLNGDRFS